MTHLQRQIDELKERVGALEGELEARKRGQKLAADDADHYELAWSKQVDDLKDFIKRICGYVKETVPRDDVRQSFLVRGESLVGQKVESDAFEDFDTELTIDILGLATEHEIPYETVACWTREEKQQAEAWAAQQHALASDNEFDESEILPKPVHVRKLEEENPKRADLHAVDLTPRVRTEPAWVTWAARMAGSPKEWERLHRIEKAARATRSAFRHPERDQVASEMCRVIDAVELERIQEFQGREWTHGGQRKKKP